MRQRFLFSVFVFSLFIHLSASTQNDLYRNLFIAIRVHHAVQVSQELNKGLSVFFANDQGETPLTAAVRAGDTNIVNLVLARGANASTADENGLTPLMYAARGEDLVMLTYLLKVGANPNVKDSSGKRARDFITNRLKRNDIFGKEP